VLTRVHVATAATRHQLSAGLCCMQMFDPGPVGSKFMNQNNAAGTHTISISSAPLPSTTVNSLIVTSNLGGASTPQRLAAGAITGTGCTF
jgi:hypothetical protein